MDAHARAAATTFLRLALLSICLTMASPVLAQDAGALDAFRAQYDAMMSNFERLSAAKGDTAGQDLARRGREAMQALTDEQLAKVYSQTRVPDLSVAAIASEYVASDQHAAQQQSLTLAPTPQSTSPPFPEAPALVAGCVGVDIDPATRYALLIIKEVTSSILAAATFVCTQDILGENGSLACVPLAIAADIANGFYDTATFCAGEVTANQVDGNYNRLEHIHNDLAAGITDIVNNDNANTATIVNNDNANTNTIVTNDNANTAAIIANDNANRDTLITEIRNLGCEIVRLLNTPEGLRASAILACEAQPGYPYNWPVKK